MVLCLCAVFSIDGLIRSIHPLALQVKCVCVCVRVRAGRNCELLKNLREQPRPLKPLWFNSAPRDTPPPPACHGTVEKRNGHIWHRVVHRWIEVPSRCFFFSVGSAPVLLRMCNLTDLTTGKMKTENRKTRIYSFNENLITYKCNHTIICVSMKLSIW